MKKNLLIWGTALILLVVAVYITTNYNKKKDVDTSSGQAVAASDSKQSSPDTLSSSGQTTTTSDSKQTGLDTSGEKAIDFTLKDLDGKKVALSDYKGKNVYLNFFATWCPPCRAEMPDIEKVYQKYKDKDFVVLAVDLGEDRNTVKSFIEKNKFNFKVLLDSDQTVGEQYSTTAIPVSIFIDKKGNIVAKKVGAMTSGEMELNVKMLIDKK